MGVAAAALVAACSSAGSLEQREVDRAEARLGDTVAALYVGPQLIDMVGAEKRGHVVLVDADGGLRTLRTRGMHGGKFSWSQRGLLFGDVASDYLLNESLHSIKSPKAEVQDGVVELDDGATQVAVYNYGQTDDGYRSQVVVTAKGAAEDYLLTGNYNFLAHCGESVYGFTVYPEGHAHRMATSAQQKEGLLLAQLYPRLDDAASVVAWDYRTRGVEMMADVATCEDGRISAFIATLDDRRPPADHEPQVGTWDVRTGRHRMMPLVTPAGDPVGADTAGPFAAKHREDYGMVALVDDQSVASDGTIEWLAPSGYVLATDPRTGVTRARFDTGAAWDPAGDTRVDFTDRSVWVAEREPEADGGISITRFDRATGERGTVIALDGILDEVGDEGNHWWGFAARPD